MLDWIKAIALLIAFIAYDSWRHITGAADEETDE